MRYVVDMRYVAGVRHVAGVRVDVKTAILAKRLYTA